MLRTGAFRWLVVGGWGGVPLWSTVFCGGLVVLAGGAAGEAVEACGADVVTCGCDGAAEGVAGGGVPGSECCACVADFE